MNPLPPALPCICPGILNDVGDLMESSIRSTASSLDELRRARDVIMFDGWSGYASEGFRTRAEEVMIHAEGLAESLSRTRRIVLRATSR